MIRTPFPLVAALLLAACQQGVIPEAPMRMNLMAEQVRDVGNGHPTRPEGACWADHVTPAIIDTVTEQILVEPASTAPDGTPRPASYRTVTQQKIVKDREQVWFRVPCPAEETPDFIATLQRALKARGLYLAPLTGAMDATTRTAIRRFQAERGLDSDVLSFAAARELGLIAADRSAL